jgi:hypothetical protein
MSIKRKLIVSAAAVCLIAASALCYYRETRPVRFRTGRSLRELSGIGTSLSEQETAAVSNMLMQYYVENENTAGFVHYSAPEDLQGLYAMYQFAKVFDAPELQADLQRQLSQIRLPAPDTLDIVNLVYYAELGYGCSLSDFDTDRVLRAFSRFYDQENHLFFLVDENDDIHKKIALTAFCAEHVPVLKNSRQFALQKGAEKAMQGYRFDTNQSLAFFNAGGDILHLYHVLDLDCTETVRQQADWFASWSELYASAEMTSISALTAERDFRSVADLFGGNAQDSKILGFYDALDEQHAAAMITSRLDALMLADAMRGIDTAGNPAAKTALTAKFQECLQQEPVFQAELNAEQTAYGVFLAESTGTALNRDKVNAFLKKEYAKLETEQNEAEQIEQLYYLVAIDGVMNQYSYMCPASTYQKMLDRTIAAADSQKPDTAMLNAERKAVEIIQNLQLHNVDVKLKKHQRDKLLRMLRTAAASERLTIGFTDILLLNDMLEADLVSAEDLQNAYQTLRTDGGICAVQDDTCTPDLYSTFLFGVCFTERNDFSKHDELCAFAEAYRNEAGLFCADAASVPFPSSVYYGFWLEKQRIGGDKS